jgi:hypothetical protein
MSNELSIDLAGLEDKWTLQLAEPPICAVCGLPIGGHEEHTGDCELTRQAPRPSLEAKAIEDYLDDLGEYVDCTCGVCEVPLMIFRLPYAMALHFKCAEARMASQR